MPSFHCVRQPTRAQTPPGCGHEMRDRLPRPTPTPIAAAPGRADAPAPVAGAPGAAAPRTAVARIGRPVWRLAWVIVIGAFAGGLDASLANIGLDTIRIDLHAGLNQVPWVTTGYLLALAVSLPACAWLSRKVGAGRLWLSALTAFTGASALCAAAPTIEVLIGFRVVQGLAAGLLIPAG